MHQSASSFNFTKVDNATSYLRQSQCQRIILQFDQFDFTAGEQLLYFTAFIIELKFG